MIVSLGGTSPGSVSKKTTLLISGHILPDGRPPDQSLKYKQALQHGKQIMTEEEFD
jgi:NAD-dependent DNA ligase